METSMRSNDQVQFETNTKLIEANCMSFMDETKLKVSMYSKDQV